MEDKENIRRKAEKRKSSNLDCYFLDIKRKSIFCSESNNEINILRDEIHDEVKSEFSITYDYNNDHETNIAEPLNVDVFFAKNITPIDQIRSMSEFKKLPKPDKIIDVKKHNVQELVSDTPFTYFNQYNTGLTETFKIGIAFNKDMSTPLDEMISPDKNIQDTSLDQSSNANDSFEMIKSRLSRFNTYTPIFINNTPETPCSLNEIDVDHDGSITSLYRKSESEYSEARFTLPKSLSLRNPHISPLFYEPELKRYDQSPGMISTSIDHDNDEEVSISEDHVIEQISVDLVSKIIDNGYTCKSYVYHIIDCRYPYEYEGGHIKGAVNLYSPHQMLSYIFLSNYNMKQLHEPLVDSEESLAHVINDILDNKQPKFYSKNDAYIFHCEFSSIRGPELARCLRNMDRLVNLAKYPKLFFPKIYIMSKGYKEFYSKYKNLCQPCNYVTMDIVDPRKQKGCSTMEESDGEDDRDVDVSEISDETLRHRLKTYNFCKKETQKQTRLFSQIINMDSSQPS